MPTCETWLEPPVIPVARWGDRGGEQGLGLRMRSGVPGLVGAGGRKRQDEGKSFWPQCQVWEAVVARLGAWAVWELGCGREGSRLANALVTLYCGAAVLAASHHVCSGKRINLYLY